MLKMNIKKNDTVLVITGKDKGKIGKVVAAIPKTNKVTVDGVNIQKKHKKPRSASSVGGIIDQIGAIDSSNVMVICDKCNKATRVAHKIEGDKKIRICKKCGASLDKAMSKDTADDKKKKKLADSAKKAETKKVVKKADVAPVETKKIDATPVDTKATEVKPVETTVEKPVTAVKKIVAAKKVVKKADVTPVEKTVETAVEKPVTAVKKTPAAKKTTVKKESVEEKAETKKPVAKKTTAKVEVSEPAKKKTAKSDKAE